MNMVPAGDNIIIKKDTITRTTESGIVLATQNQEKSIDRGTVMAVGQGRLLNDGTIVPPSVSEGDYVIFNKFAGSEIVVDDVIYLLIKENDILAIID
jgi:chaperonin GroES